MNVNAEFMTVSLFMWLDGVAVLEKPHDLKYVAADSTVEQHDLTLNVNILINSVCIVLLLEKYPDTVHRDTYEWLHITSVSCSICCVV